MAVSRWFVVLRRRYDNLATQPPPPVSFDAFPISCQIHPRQSHLFPLLGGVLAVGNIKFDDHGDGNCATVVQNPEDDDALARTAACFGVDAAELEAALTSVTLVVGGGGDAAGGRALTGGGRARRDASSWIGRGSSVRVDRLGEGVVDRGRFHVYIELLFSFVFFVWTSRKKGPGGSGLGVPTYVAEIFELILMPVKFLLSPEALLCGALCPFINMFSRCTWRYSWMVER